MLLATRIRVVVPRAGRLFDRLARRKLDLDIEFRHRPCVATEGRNLSFHMPDEEEIYQEHILDHYEDPYHRGHCAHPTHAHEDDNPLCGDEVRIELDVDPSGRIREAYFDGDGCCISQAAASMLVEHVEGKDVEFVRGFSAEEMLKLFGARLTPNRQKCCLLSWKVLQSAVFSPIGQSSNGGEAK